MKLVFVHGSGGWGGMWKKQLEYFPGADAVTLPGHPEGDLCRSVDAYAGWLHEYIARRQYKDVVLAGHSLGGAIALTCALEYPGSLSALVLAGTGARLRVHPQFKDRLQAAVDGDLDAWVEWLRLGYQGLPREEREDLVEKHLQIGPAAQLNDLLCCDDFDVMARLPEISVPTLVICGDRDAMTPVRFSSYLAGNIPGARKVIIEGTTHYLFMEKPDAFNQAVERFLRHLRP
ncbi:MAG: alpha/beta hydrolase [Dehalococcoidia bacterium]|nr:alpha/beta hydrolase [Dehalococcoidia bacterium]